MKSEIIHLTHMAVLHDKQARAFKSMSKLSLAMAGGMWSVFPFYVMFNGPYGLLTASVLGLLFLSATSKACAEDSQGKAASFRSHRDVIGWHNREYLDEHCDTLMRI